MSLKTNIFYNVSLSVLNVLFPIITAPYISRVLGVENIGLVDFSTNYAGYFILFTRRRQRRRSQERRLARNSAKALKTTLIDTYNAIRVDIDKRLRDFARVWVDASDIELFREMAFCMCTPQTSAHKSWSAVSALFDRKLLAKGGAEQIAPVLREHGVRFHNNKARYIVQNREKFYPKTREHIGKILELPQPHDYLYNNIEGWGMKEAAHFLRNIGFGDYAAILDRHILRRLAVYGVIPEIPAALSTRVYRETDEKMKAFAESCGIPFAALDLVFWYEETGEIFK
jgi:N-glycosylase/DNA lyase